MFFQKARIDHAMENSIYAIVFNNLCEKKNHWTILEKL